VLSAKRYVSASGWGTAQIIDGEGQSRFLNLALVSVGRALVVWSQLLPATKNIWANRFELGGAP